QPQALGRRRIRTRSIPTLFNAPSGPEIRQRFLGGRREMGIDSASLSLLSPSWDVLLATLRRDELTEKPRAGEGPVAFGGPANDAQGRGRLIQGKPGEESELDEVGTARVHPGELAQGMVEVEQVVGWRVVGDEAIEVETPAPAAAAPLEPLAVAGAVDEDSPHGF